MMNPFDIPNFNPEIENKCVNLRKNEAENCPMVNTLPLVNSFSGDMNIVANGGERIKMHSEIKIENNAVEENPEKCDKCRSLQKKLNISRGWNRFFKEKLLNIDKVLHIINEYENEKTKNLELQLAYDQRSREWSQQQEQLINLLHEIQPLREQLKRAEETVAEERKIRLKHQYMEQSLKVTVEQLQAKITEMNSISNPIFVESLGKKLTNARSETKKIKCDLEFSKAEVEELRAFISNKHNYIEKLSKRLYWALLLADKYGKELMEVTGKDSACLDEWEDLQKQMKQMYESLQSQYITFKSLHQKKFKGKYLELNCITAFPEWLIDFDNEKMRQLIRGEKSPISKAEEVQQERKGASDIENEATKLEELLGDMSDNKKTKKEIKSRKNMVKEPEKKSPKSLLKKICSDSESNVEASPRKTPRQRKGKPKVIVEAKTTNTTTTTAKRKKSLKNKQSAKDDQRNDSSGTDSNSLFKNLFNKSIESPTKKQRTRLSSSSDSQSPSPRRKVPAPQFKVPQSSPLKRSRKAVFTKIMSETSSSDSESNDEKEIESKSQRVVKKVDTYAEKISRLTSAKENTKSDIASLRERDRIQINEIMNEMTQCPSLNFTPYSEDTDSSVDFDTCFKRKPTLRMKRNIGQKTSHSKSKIKEGNRAFVSQIVTRSTSKRLSISEVESDANENAEDKGTQSAEIAAQTVAGEVLNETDKENNKLNVNQDDEDGDDDIVSPKRKRKMRSCLSSDSEAEDTLPSKLSSSPILAPRNISPLTLPTNFTPPHQPRDSPYSSSPSQSPARFSPIQFSGSYPKSPTEPVIPSPKDSYSNRSPANFASSKEEEVNPEDTEPPVTSDCNEVKSVGISNLFSTSYPHSLLRSDLSISSSNTDTENDTCDEEKVKKNDSSKNISPDIFSQKKSFDEDLDEKLNKEKSTFVSKLKTEQDFQDQLKFKKPLDPVETSCSSPSKEIKLNSELIQKLTTTTATINSVDTTPLVTKDASDFSSQKSRGTVPEVQNNEVGFSLSEHKIVNASESLKPDVNNKMWSLFSDKRSSPLSPIVFKSSRKRSVSSSSANSVSLSVSSCGEELANEKLIRIRSDSFSSKEAEEEEEENSLIINMASDDEVLSTSILEISETPVRSPESDGSCNATSVLQPPPPKENLSYSQTHFSFAQNSQNNLASSTMLSGREEKLGEPLPADSRSPFLPSFYKERARNSVSEDMPHVLTGMFDDETDKNEAVNEDSRAQKTAETRPDSSEVKTTIPLSHVRSYLFSQEEIDSLGREEFDTEHLQDLFQEIIACHFKRQEWSHFIQKICKHVSEPSGTNNFSRFQPFVRAVLIMVLRSSPFEVQNPNFSVPPSMYKLFQIVRIIENYHDLPTCTLDSLVNVVAHRLILTKRLRPNSLASLTIWFMSSCYAQYNTFEPPKDEECIHWSRCFLVDLIFHHKGLVHEAILAAINSSRKLFIRMVKYREATALEQIIFWIALHGNWIGLKATRTRLAEVLKVKLGLHSPPPEQPVEILKSILTVFAMPEPNKDKLATTKPGFLLLLKWVSSSWVLSNLFPLLKAVYYDESDSQKRPLHLLKKLIADCVKAVKWEKADEDKFMEYLKRFPIVK